jgi:putative nucleotidyltransferase with HDIG domain
MTPKDALHLLHRAGCPPDVIAHAQAVAECAREIAMRYNERHRNHTGADIELVIAGALLHDIGRARSNGIDHAVVGAEIAQAFGLDTRIVRIIRVEILVTTQVHKTPSCDFAISALLDPEHIMRQTGNLTAEYAEGRGGRING